MFERSVMRMLGCIVVGRENRHIEIMIKALLSVVVVPLQDDVFWLYCRSFFIRYFSTDKT
jgi:hypothetical protein